MIAVARRDAIPAFLADEEMLFNLAQLGFEQAGEGVKLQGVDRGMTPPQTLVYPIDSTFTSDGLTASAVKVTSCDVISFSFSVKTGVTLANSYHPTLCSVLITYASRVRYCGAQ